MLAGGGGEVGAGGGHSRVHATAGVNGDAALLESEATALRQLARIAPLFVSGHGATADLTRLGRVRRLDGDLVAAADDVARMSNH